VWTIPLTFYLFGIERKLCYWANECYRIHDIYNLLQKTRQTYTNTSLFTLAIGQQRNKRSQPLKCYLPLDLTLSHLSTEHRDFFKEKKRNNERRKWVMNGTTWNWSGWLAVTLKVKFTESAGSNGDEKMMWMYLRR